MNNIKSVLLSSSISDWDNAGELLDGRFLLLNIFRDEYGMVQDSGLTMKHYNHPYHEFDVVDESKFTIFVLKYPELVKNIS